MQFPTTASEIQLNRLNLELDVLMAQHRLDNFNVAYPTTIQVAPAETKAPKKESAKPKAEAMKPLAEAIAEEIQPTVLEYAKDVQPVVLKAGAANRDATIKLIASLGADHASKVAPEKRGELVAGCNAIIAEAASVG